MFRRITVTAALACICCAALMPVFAQAQGAFNPEQYKKALWMVTRFYGAQRSGLGPNWLLMDHTYKTSFTQDADAGRNLEGGWFDCGDHVLFGHTFFYAAYMLAKAYDQFPSGFHDLYNGKDYSDYAAAQDWSVAGGKANGIPDLLEELKYATDWIIKATPDANTFYYEKGEGGPDHNTWVTAGKMSTQAVSDGGEPRKMWKNPNDGHLASYAAAAMAIMSRIYRKYDPDYADKCLQHAKNAYGYAKPRKEQSAGAGSGGYYGATSHKGVAFVIAASEMFLTTGEASYKNDIDESKLTNHNWALDYSNPNDLAAYSAAMALSDKKDTHLNFLRTTFINRFTGQTNTEKVSTVGNASWGALRYPANHAFVAALYSKAAGVAEFDQFIFNQVDYILGKNNSNQSFVVGFCEGCQKQATKPHHRNVYLNDDNPNADGMSNLVIPERNKYFGYMVGGSFSSGSYKDNINEYQYTEGGIDYNAGLVGALAYVVSKTAPADTSKFGKPPVTAEPKDMKISTSQNPDNTVSYIRAGDTLYAGAAESVTLYAYLFDKDGTLIADICEDVVWSNSLLNSNDPITGCSYTVINLNDAPTVNAEYNAGNVPIPFSMNIVVTAGEVSVRHKAASLAKNGYAISVRPNSVTFTVANGRKITKLSVLNLKGRRVFGKAGAYSEIKWDSAARPKGIYLVRMTMDNGAVVQRNLLLK